MYGAYDPELDRRVAIKLLHADERRPDAAGTKQARLLREAQAMARLTHPNVIAVYDVGSFGAAVFVAMEFVSGVTLADHFGEAWSEGTPAWSDTVRIYAAAGRGLAAAHAAEIVHRDFKPANVMLADDGRVLVLDFGLARSTEDTSTSSMSTTGGQLANDLTRTGAVMGTPAYMSPEQLKGEVTDAATDQFSLCVALYQALWGERPFAGDTLPELTASVLDGRIRDVPRGTQVPASVRRAVLRGLALDPRDRHPTMLSLCTELEHTPARRRRIAFGVAGATGLLGALVVGAYMGAPPSPCTDAAQAMQDVWNPAREDGVRRSFAEVGKAYAADSVDKVLPMLEAYAQEWAAQRQDACRAARVRGEQSDHVMGLRMACLDRSLHRLDAFLEVLGDADASVATRSIASAHKLPALSDCEDVEQLMGEVAPPDDPQIRNAVEALRRELVRAPVWVQAGRPQQAREHLDELLAEAEMLDYPPIVAEVLRMIARLDADLGDAPGAVEAAGRALVIAEATGFDFVIVRSLITLAFTEGVMLDDFDRARERTERAAAVIARRGNLAADRIDLASTRGYVERKAGHTAAAVLHFEDAWEQLVEAGRGGGPEALPILNALGIAYVRQNQLEAADEVAERALALSRDLLGPRHPNVAATLGMMARLHRARDEHEAALEAQREAREIFVDSLGSGHRNVAALDNDIGLSLVRLGRPAQAYDVYERARKGLVASRGEDHLDVASVRSNLGNLARDLGRLPEALEHHQASLRIKRARLEPGHVQIAYAHDNIGDDHVAAGRLDAAMESYAKSVALFEQADTDDPHLAYPLAGIGRVHLERGNIEQAAVVLERAVSLDIAADASPNARARAVFPLARVRWAQGDVAAAVALAEQAEVGLATRSASNQEKLARVRRWRAEHGLAGETAG